MKVDTSPTLIKVGTSPAHKSVKNLGFSSVKAERYISKQKGISLRRNIARRHIGGRDKNF
jgi:hypothetical protein